MKKIFLSLSAEKLSIVQTNTFRKLLVRGQQRMIGILLLEDEGPGLLQNFSKFLSVDMA
jgi:hypothetical protein